MTIHNPIQGAGLGLRRAMMTSDTLSPAPSTSFFEVAPENWIRVGGRYGERLKQLSERVPLIAHGLSLSIGGMGPLNRELVYSVKQFLKDYQISIYSEHLSFTDDGGQLYELLPLPFTDEAVRYVSARIRQTQDMLETTLALENVSYYLTPGPASQQPMGEAEFINAVLDEADCELLLDINNVFVNSVNHHYDPIAFIDKMPAERIRYYHVAGHFVENDGLIIDTHGADVIDPVWELLGYTYRNKGTRPTLLERDFNIPATEALAAELAIISRLQQEVYGYERHRVA